MALDPLALVADLEATLGRALTTEEAARADALLASASARVRVECRQDLTAATSTVRRRVIEGVVRLPQRPVTDVTDVKRPDGTALTFNWPGLGHVQVWLLAPLDDFVDVPWPPHELDVVDVTYDHGYTEIPAELVAVTVNIALRALGQKPTDGGTSKETIQSYSYERGTVGAAGPLGLLPDERELCKRYAAGRGVGTVRLA